MFKLNMVGPKSKKTLNWNPHLSGLFEEDGNKVPLEMVKRRYNDGFDHADFQFTGRKKNLKTIKIQMGFSCNFSCAYCSQATHASHVGGSMNEVQSFLENWNKWAPASDDAGGADLRIEFWGGEPFVYWKHLQTLVPAMRALYPNAALLIITNGSMLDDEKVDWIIKHQISLGISHDGPAQKLRNPEDILDDPECVRLLLRLIKEHRDKQGQMMLGFNSVLTIENFSLTRGRSQSSKPNHGGCQL